MSARRPSILAALGVTFFLATFAVNASAEDGAVGVDGAFVLPVGDWSDVSGIGIGALAAGHYDLSPQLAITGRIGYIHHLSKSQGGSDFSTYEIPILGGAKYRFGQPGDGLYVGGEVGLVSLGARSEFENPYSGEKESASDSDLEIGLTAGVGYEVGDLDFRGQMFFPTIDHLDDFMGVMATVGYRFARF